jgi:membrane protein implicated in regulation of membrane protease activity
MHVGRTGLLVALAFWCGFALLVRQGAQADWWVLGVEFLVVVLLSAAALWQWRPGQTANLPRSVGDWLTDDRPRPSHRRP